MITLRVKKSRHGQALVEFAVILPMLILLVMGIVQFGMMLGSYLSLQNAVREGARAGITGSTNDEIKGVIISTSPTLEPGKLIITITPSGTLRTSGDTLTVKLTYNYNLTVP
ncbi:MAG TPA: TadE family protein, partial [Clostridia bacterium]